jgi:hypothetical protein
MARRKRSTGSLPRPPAGTYDPAIDAAERAAQRGYGDLQSDTSRDSTRAASDFGIGLSDITQTRDYGLADILRGKTRAGEDINAQGGQIAQDYSRGLADLLTARTRGGEDYRSSVATLDRNYQQLGGHQGQATAAAGAGAGGALAQALQKRTANEAIQRAPIDTNYNRFTADSAQAETRLGQNRDEAVAQLDQARQRGIEDYGTQQDRLTTQFGTGGSSYQGGNAWADAWLGKNPGAQLPGTTDNGLSGQRLSLQFQRGSEDRSTGLARGGRELNAYQQDLIPTRYYAAAGLTPYTPPKRKRTVR